jgi:hypothetical protein
MVSISPSYGTQSEFGLYDVHYIRVDVVNHLRDLQSYVLIMGGDCCILTS